MVVAAQPPQQQGLVRHRRPSRLDLAQQQQQQQRDYRRIEQEENEALQPQVPENPMGPDASATTTNTLPPCIVTLHGMILDVSQWVHEHPGGAHVVQRYHGRDATQAFETAGHSDAARSLLVGFSLSSPSNDDDRTTTTIKKPLVSQPTTLVLVVFVLAWLHGVQRHTDLPPPTVSPRPSWNTGKMSKECNGNNNDWTTAKPASIGTTTTATTTTTAAASLASTKTTASSSPSPELERLKADSNDRAHPCTTDLVWDTTITSGATLALDEEEEQNWLN